jgi:hypothetical protein
LQKAKEFVLMHLLKAIPDPELFITEADIDLQLCKRLISTSAEMGLDPDLLSGKRRQQVVMLIRWLGIVYLRRKQIMCHFQALTIGTA